MRFLMFVHFLGKWMMLFNTVLLPSIVVSALYRDGELAYFLLALLVNTAAGGALWITGGRHRLQLNLHDGFILVVVMWLATSLIGAAHLVFSLGISLTDAFFEVVSALTTTGSTVLTGLDSLPPSVLMFRQILQWLGGIGVVVTAVALLPMLGIGGMQMIKAEAPGPFKEEKLTPRIRHTAAALWKLYLVITATCALAYWFAGMSAFDAVAHSFSTVSTGGFSTHDASFAYFDSALIESLGSIFMLIGAISFTVHWMAWRRLSFDIYWQSEEVRYFLVVVAVATVLVAAELYAQGSRETIAQAFRASSFTVVSVITNTGFGVDNFSLWPTFLPIFLTLLSFFGGCGASTAGGIKVVRFVILVKVIRLQLFQLVHPRGVKRLQLQGASVDTRVVNGVMGFVTLYIVISAVLVLVLMGLGMDLETAYGAVTAAINNLGPGLGDVAADFHSVSAASKWILAFTMLLGRLELFTILVLFSPAFWKN